MASELGWACMNIVMSTLLCRSRDLVPSFIDLTLFDYLSGLSVVSKTSLGLRSISVLGDKISRIHDVEGVHCVAAMNSIGKAALLLFLVAVVFKIFTASLVLSVFLSLAQEASQVVETAKQLGFLSLVFLHLVNCLEHLEEFGEPESVLVGGVCSAVHVKFGVIDYLYQLLDFVSK